MQYVAALIAAATIATMPSTATAEALQPTSKWAVDYGETACVAMRYYGDPKNPVVLALRPSLNDATVRVMIARAGGYTAAEHFAVKVSDFKTTGLRFFAKEGKRRIVWIDLTREQFDQRAADRSITFFGSNLDLDLSTAGMAAAVKALRVCNADLRKHWNADEAGQARIASSATPTVRPDRLIASGDYPSQALKELRGGRTRIAVLVDETGATKDCVVEEHSGVATIDAQTCIIVMKRSKFEPARDSAGKPVKSFLSYSFKWQIG